MRKLIKNKKIKIKNGFTIIELAIVIGAIAALALTLVPNVTAYVQKADDARIESNIREVHRATELVIQTNPSLSIRGIYQLERDAQDKILSEVSAYANIKDKKNEDS